MTREEIAKNLIDLAQDIAERRYYSKTAIESLCDDLLADIDNEGVFANVQEVVESWAYTWLDYLQQAIDRPCPEDALKALNSLPLEKHFPDGEVYRTD